MNNRILAAKCMQCSSMMMAYVICEVISVTMLLQNHAGTISVAYAYHLYLSCMTLQANWRMA